jgi:hypothetical protein
MPDKPKDKGPTNAEFSDWLREVESDDRIERAVGLHKSVPSDPTDIPSDSKEAPMPIKRLLEGSSFASESIDEIAKAYQAVIGALGIADESSREMAAKVVLGLAAEQKVLDAKSLSDEAILKLKGHFLRDNVSGSQLAASP